MEKVPYRIKGNFISVHFDNTTDLLDYKLPRDYPKENHRTFKDNVMSGGKSGGSWLGPTVESPKDAIEKSLIGDHQLYRRYLLPKIEKLRKEIKAEDIAQIVESPRRFRTFKNSGDELDIHRVYQGQLDKAWSTTYHKKEKREINLITLFIQIQGVALVDAKDTLWAAAVAVMLSDQLTKLGKSVKIIVGGASKSVTYKQHGICVSATVKQYNERLTLERLAAMSHIGFYRTFGFGAKACQPYAVDPTLGRSYDMTPADYPLQLQDEIHRGHSNVILVPRAHSESAAKRSYEMVTKKLEMLSGGES